MLQLRLDSGQSPQYGNAVRLIVQSCTLKNVTGTLLRGCLKPRLSPIAFGNQTISPAEKLKLLALSY
jgi:hypothetical protein